MRICHCVEVAPNRCGLYGTARDLIKSEKMSGYDAGILDCALHSGTVVNGKVEGYPKVKEPLLERHDYEWAKQADVYVRHSYIPVELQNLGKPLILAMHGRPESSFRLEQSGINPVVTAFSKRGQDDRYKAFITFWPEYMLHWSTVVPKEKLFYVPAPVDLEYYAPFGKPFQLGEHSGSPNILICDVWREDVLPFNMIFAALRFQQLYCKTAKIHILALQGQDLNIMSAFLKGVKEAGALGVLGQHTTEINKFYAACDMVITPHTIATRTVREPLACGVPVVAGTGNKYTPYTANPMDINGFAKVINDCWVDLKDDGATVREYARKTAEKYFNPKITGKAIKEILERI